MTSKVPTSGDASSSSDAAPWTTQQGRVKFIEFAARAAHLTRRDFHLYWQRHHSPHRITAPGSTS